MKFALLFVFLVSQFALSQSDSCRTAPFLSATRFNAAFQNNFNAPSADVEGSLAAGGSISVQSYTIGLLLRCNGGCCTPNTDNAIAGTSFTWNGGDLMTGNLVYGTTLTNSSWTLHCGAAIKRDSTSFFSTLVSDIQSTSSYLYSLPTTGTPEIKWSSFNMDLSAGRTLNVFKTTCNDLVNSVSQYQIQSGTSAQTVIINVEGTGACSMKNSFLPNSGYWTKVIWNFVNATSLTIGSVNGSIIAPYADVSYSSGRLDGQLFAKSMSGGGQINWYQFSGCIPTPSTTGTTSTSGTTGSTSTSGTTGSTSTSGTTGSTSTSGSTGTTGADICSQLVIAAPGCTCQNSGGKCSCQCPCC